jgi:hypothetical protein
LLYARPPSRNRWEYGSKPKGSSQTQSGTSDSSTASYDGSPVQMGNYHHSHTGMQHHSLHPQDANPYFPHLPGPRTMGASVAERPLGQTPSSSPAQTAGKPASLQTTAEDFAHLAGTSPHEYLYQHSHDRFSFRGPETYALAAIRG